MQSLREELPEYLKQYRQRFRQRYLEPTLRLRVNTRKSAVDRLWTNGFDDNNDATYGSNGEEVATGN